MFSDGCPPVCLLQYLYFHICKHSRHKGQTVLHMVSRASTHTKGLSRSARPSGPLSGVSSHSTFPQGQGTVYTNVLKHPLIERLVGEKQTRVRSPQIISLRIFLKFIIFLGIFPWYICFISSYVLKPHVGH